MGDVKAVVEIGKRAERLVESLESLTIREANELYGANWTAGILERLERLVRAGHAADTKMHFPESKS